MPFTPGESPTACRKRPSSSNSTACPFTSTCAPAAANPCTTTPSVCTVAPFSGPRTSSSPPFAPPGSLAAVGVAAGGRGLGVGTTTGVAVTTTTTGVGVSTGARGSAVTQPAAANSSAADSAIAPNALPKEFGIFGKFDNLSKFDRLDKFGKIDKFDKTFQSAPKFNVRLRRNACGCAALHARLRQWLGCALSFGGRIRGRRIVERQAQRECRLLVGFGRRALYRKIAAVPNRKRVRDVQPQPGASSSLPAAPTAGVQPRSNMCRL